MDYKTKPTSREELRTIARWVKHTFKCKNKFRFDVIHAFERIPLLFPQVTTEIVDDNSTDVISNLNVPGTCNPDMKGNYHIVVREKVYDGACRGVGGYRAHVLHEMCHAILCLLGFTPVLDRTFKNYEIEPCYLSMEWQAKALTQEIMVPYEETKGMSKKKIKHLCKVSNDLIDYKKSIDEHDDDNDWI